MKPDFQTIADLLRSHAVARPDGLALACEDRKTTFATLEARANQVAHGLKDVLAEPGGRFAVLDTNSDTFFELLFGAARANRVLVPLNFRLMAHELADVVADAGVEMLFVGSDFLDIASTVQRTCPGLRQIVTLGQRRDDWVDYTSWRDGRSTADPAATVTRSDVVLLGYTSGTTGKPKGAQLTHANLLANAPLLIQEYGSSPHIDVGLVCMPLFHVSGSLWALSCFYADVPIVVLRRAMPEDVLRTIAEWRVTKTLLVPAVIQMLLAAPERDRYDLSSLDLVLYGGSPISLPLLRQALAAFGCNFGQVYGLTESAGAITYLSPTDHRVDDQRLQSCGKPLSHVEIGIVDEHGRLLREPGCIGEIVCRTAQNMKGYWNDADATAEVLRDGWLHTGDAGYFDQDRYLYIHDRIKDVIISGGENIYPAEIERTLAAHPMVADVAVIGVPDDRWGEVPKALVVRKPNSDVSAGALITFCAARMAGYKVPRSIEFMDALKRNASGKLLKHELRAPYWTERDRKVN